MEGHKEPVKVRFWTSQGVGVELMQTPLHKSQVILGEADNGFIFEIEVCYNWELLCSLMQYGSNLVVLEPYDIRYQVANAIGQSLNEYGFQVDPLALEMVVPENREIMALIGHGIERKSCARSQECPGYLDFSQEVGCKKQGPRSYQNQSPDMVREAGFEPARS